MSSQQIVNDYIEQHMAKLCQNVRITSFEKTLKQNIVMKKQSATNEEDFFDRLMLNITYFIENSAVWVKILRSTIGEGIIPTTTYIESEALAQQMRIRQMVAEKSDDYKKMFHSQYKALQVTEEAVVYDYAYASVAHALRFDFLTYLSLQKSSDLLLTGDFEEVLRITEGYVAYYTDQIVQQMELLEGES